MAKQMAYTDAMGNEYPASYWRVNSVQINKGMKVADVELKGYKDAAHVTAQPIGEHCFRVHPENFDTYFAATVIDPLNVNHLAQAYKALNELPAQEGSISFYGALDV